MGRGRAKAKQTKVARELKYQSPNTDLAALQRELSGGGRKSADDFDELDQYADSDDDDDDVGVDADPRHWSSPPR